MYSRAGERGTTLLDVVVGTGLMVIVFVGIVGAFRLAIDAVSNNKARAGAIALANERLEYIRSLAYDSIGTVGGIPAGALDQATTTILNDVRYTRRTFVSYEDDPQDGLGAADTNGIPTDFKAAKVQITWESRQGTRTITMITRISPPTGVEQAVPGGTISIQVTNAAALPIENASVHIVNASTSPAIDLATFTDATGFATVLGAPAAAGYQVTVSKAGYSISQTYGTTATNTNPIPAHLGVALNQTTISSFAIDLVGTMTIQSFHEIAQGTSTDSFATESGIASSSNIAVVSGIVRLTGQDPYVQNGTIISNAIATSSLARWRLLSWTDTEPVDTEIRYQVYDGGGNVLIPEGQLPGNETGFTSSPVDLDGVSTSTFGALSILAFLSSTNASTTPSIDSWSIAMEAGPTPIANVDVMMSGTKTIGSGPSGPVYKYSAQHSTGASGSVSIGNVEYDTYSLSVPSVTNYDVSSSCDPQPTVLPPGGNVISRLFLAPHTANSLLVDIKSADGAVIPSATVRLYRSPYDTTITSDSCGQSFFSGISAGSVGGGNPYTIDVSAAGYAPYTSPDVNVSGTTRLSIVLN